MPHKCSADIQAVIAHVDDVIAGKMPLQFKLSRMASTWATSPTQTTLPVLVSRPVKIHNLFWPRRFSDSEEPLGLAVTAAWWSLRSRLQVL